MPFEYGDQPEAATCGGQIIVSDEPEDWSSLVEQIAELEELLTETANARDNDVHDVSVQLRRILSAKRQRLREIDVAC